MRRSGVDAGTNQFCVSSVLFMDPHQHPLIRGRLISVGVSVESWIVAPALSNAFRSSRSQHVVHGVYPWMHCIFTCIRFLRVWPNSGDICREHAISGNCVRASRCHRVAAHVAYTPKSDCVTQWRIWTARVISTAGPVRRIWSDRYQRNPPQGTSWCASHKAYACRKTPYGDAPGS